MITLTPTSLQNHQTFGIATSTKIQKTPFHQCLANDLEAAFFATTDFQEQVIYTHATGENSIYACLINAPFVSVSASSEITNSDNNMQIRMIESKLIRSARKKDVAIIRGVKYVVDDVQPDGVGTITLYMNKA